jgi:peptide/nickel transport system substrate-binding protein
MKLGHLICKALSVTLVFFAIAFTFLVTPANSAPEPGTVTIVIPAEAINLDPLDCIRGTTGRMVLKNVAEPLVDFNINDGSLTPRLATSWKQIDAKTWHFFLRKGVKFHDGADFNADTVVFTVKRLYDKRVYTQTKDKFFSTITLEAKALDSHTVEIKVDKPEPLLVTLMGIVAICSPNTPMDKLTRNPIGTGPYKFAKWDAGSQIVLERFDG